MISLRKNKRKPRIKTEFNKQKTTFEYGKK